MKELCHENSYLKVLWTKIAPSFFHDDIAVDKSRSFEVLARETRQVQNLRIWCNRSSCYTVYCYSATVSLRIVHTFSKQSRLHKCAVCFNERISPSRTSLDISTSFFPKKSPMVTGNRQENSPFF